MSHELTQRADGLVEFAYRADHGLPWHGLGQPVPETEYHDIPAWTRKSGMDWAVKRTQVRYGVKNQRVIEDLHVLYRSDTGDHLGIVSDGYKIVQPGQVMEFFRDLARAGGVELSAAGTIYGGKRFWATAKIGEASPASLRDRVNGFLLFSTSADGSLASEVRRTSTRVVCRNTMAVALGEKPCVRITHRSVLDNKAIKEYMGLNQAAWDAFRHSLTRLANKSVDVETAEEITAAVIAKVVPFSDTKTETDKARETAGFAKIMELFNGSAIGSNLDGVRETAWGLLNATTEYADHHVRAHNDQNRFVSAQWGAGADLKDRMFAALTA